MDDLSAIKSLHEKDMSASKQRDIKTLITLWTEDGVLLNPGQEPIIGKEAIWDYMKKEADKDQVFEIMEYVHNFEEIRILGEWAYEWGNFRGVYRVASGGEPMEQRARLFRILKKEEDGSWKCARAIWHELSIGEEKE